MRRLLALALGVTAVAAAPLAAGAPRSSQSDLTVAARPSSVTFGQSTTISGILSTPARDGRRIDLQQKPYGARLFNTIDTTSTDADGAYSFTSTPGVNSRYRVLARAASQLTSGEIEVPVRYRVSLRLSDYTPGRCQGVRFSGGVQPEHDGRPAYIEKQTSSGWRSVASATVRDGGQDRSAYGRLIRVCGDGVYRTRMMRDADHVTGESRSRRVNVP